MIGTCMCGHLARHHVEDAFGVTCVRCSCIALRERPRPAPTCGQPGCTSIDVRLFPCGRRCAEHIPGPVPVPDPACTAVALRARGPARPEPRVYGDSACAAEDCVGIKCKRGWPSPLACINTVGRRAPQDDAQHATREGITRADEHADPVWKSVAWSVLLDLCATRDEWTTDDFWLAMRQRPDVSTHEPRALGALIQRLIREGHTAKTGRISESVRPEAHKAVVFVYAKPST